MVCMRGKEIEYRHPLVADLTRPINAPAVEPVVVQIDLVVSQPEFVLNRGIGSRIGILTLTAFIQASSKYREASLSQYRISIQSHGRFYSYTVAGGT